MFLPVTRRRNAADVLILECLQTSNLRSTTFCKKPLYPALNLPFKTTSTPPVVMTNRLPRIYRSRPCTDTLQTAQEYRKNNTPLHVPPRAGVSPHRASCLGHCRSCHPILGGHTRARSPSLPRRNVGTPGSPGVVDAGWTGVACWLGHSWDHSVRVRAHTGNPCTRDLETTTLCWLYVAALLGLPA